MSETLLNAAYSTSVSGLHAAGTAMQAMKQALEALENGGRIETNEAITALRLAIEQAEKQAALDRMADNARELGLDYEPVNTKVNFEAIPEQISAPVAHSIVAGALFDFMGWLTTRREPLVLSGADDAAPAADAIRDFAQMRSLSINDAQVQEWQKHLATPPRREWVGLTDEEVDGVKHTFDWASPWTLADFARAIEAKLREKNA